MSDLLDIDGTDSEFLAQEVFFAPSCDDALDHLLGEYRERARRIQAVAAFLEEPSTLDVSHYFLEGNGTDTRSGHSLGLSAKQLFSQEGAIKALNSAYWSKALALTNVLDMMPQARRDEWHQTLRTHSAPAFEEQAVRTTIMDLLDKRPQYLAERVDGMFRGLSGAHVTNCPEGFSKRMIVDYVLSDWGSVSNKKAGLVNDLRCVIAKFMGREEPAHYMSERLINSMRSNWGEWVSVDGGALRLRLYKKGTIHLEVHPDMSWRLNQILAYLHPMAIPAQFRQKQPKAAKPVTRILRPLPFAVIELLGAAKPASEQLGTEREGIWYKDRPRTLNIVKNAWLDKHVLAEAEQVLLSIGGVPNPGGWFDFDYFPAAVLAEIVASGCVPDYKTHQFYPTPEGLAAQAAELAQIGQADSCLEPSAGMGGLARFLPQERTTCVEVSALYAEVLKAKGYKTEQTDFLQWSGQRFDRIVMNPPFDRGQWAAHLAHAASMLKEGGKLVAILPSGAKSKTAVKDCNLVWHGPFDNAFAGASVSVVILVATKV